VLFFERLKALDQRGIWDVEKITLPLIVSGKHDQLVQTESREGIPGFQESVHYFTLANGMSERDTQQSFYAVGILAYIANATSDELHGAFTPLAAFFARFALGFAMVIDLTHSSFLLMWGYLVRGTEDTPAVGSIVRLCKAPASSSARWRGR
jgi:hypothetical protein